MKIIGEVAVEVIEIHISMPEINLKRGEVMTRYLDTATLETGWG